MKKLFIAAIMMLSMSSVSNATVLTFEDLSGNNDALSDGYGGFNWNSMTTVGSIAKDQYIGSGYDVGTIGNVSVYNWYGTSPTNISLATPGTFTFNGAQFTSAWYNQTLTFQGYFNGNLIKTSSAYNISTTSPTWIELDWSGLTSLEIFNTNYHWDMDNFTFNNSAPVPEPGTMALLGFGMLGLAIYGKRRMNKEA